MPDGMTHYRLWKLGWIISAPASFYLSVKNPVFGIGSFVGYMAGKYVTPDWDIAGLTHDEGMIINDFKILGNLIVGYTTIYGIACRRHHRSFGTHFPVVSTLGRLVFLFWWVPLVAWHYDISFDWWMMWAALGFWWGLSMSDCIHYTADMTVGDKHLSKQVLRKIQEHYEGFQ